MAERESVLPQGDALRKAVQWISDRRRDEPARPLYRVIEEAAVRFDLSPLQVDTLTRTLGRA